MPFTLQTSLDNKTPNDVAAAPNLIVMHPKEEKIGDYILLELSIILDNGSSKSQQVIVTSILLKN